jgi:hypothetical protein
VVTPQGPVYGRQTVERYQTAAGLEVDLRCALAEWQRRGKKLTPSLWARAIYLTSY